MFRVWQDDKDALARVSVVSCSGVIYDELRQQLYIYTYRKLQIQITVFVLLQHQWLIEKHQGDTCGDYHKSDLVCFLTKLSNTLACSIVKAHVQKKAEDAADLVTSHQSSAVRFAHIKSAQQATVMEPARFSTQVLDYRTRISGVECGPQLTCAKSFRTLKMYKRRSCNSRAHHLLPENGAKVLAILRLHGRSL